MRSDDLGASWQETETGAIRFPEDTGAALARVWQLRPDTADRPGVVWAGCEPHSLWRSTDGGGSFELVRGLWDHPHRSEEHTSELQSRQYLVCRLLLEKKKK